MPPVVIYLILFAAISVALMPAFFGGGSYHFSAYSRFKWLVALVVALVFSVISLLVEWGSAGTISNRDLFTLGTFLLSLFALVREARRIWPDAKQARLNKTKQPSFFWQGLFILLPVLLLAILGGLSLKSDRKAAEDDGRKLASEEMGKLKKALESHHDEFFKYGNAAFAWESLQRINAGAATGHAAVERDVLAGEQQFPGINFSRMPFRDLRFERVGEEMIFTGPKDLGPPEPPAWAQNLTERQFRTWQAAKAAIASKDWGSAEPALSYLSTNQPGAGLEENVAFLSLKARTRHMKGAELIDAFVASPVLQTLAKTEAGLPLRELALHELLSRLPDGQGIPESIRNALGRRLVLGPRSFLSHFLLNESKRVAGSHESSLKMVQAVESLWKSEERTGEMVQQFIMENPPPTWQAKGFWLTNQQEIFLATVLAEGPRTNGSLTANHTNHFVTVRFVPASVVERALTEAVEKSNLSVPNFAVISVEVAGKKFGVRKDQWFTDSNVDIPVLAETSADLLTFPSKTPIKIETLLTNRDQLYLRQQERAIWLSLLIVAAASSALVGFVSAQKSFYRQLRLNELKSNFVSSVSHELRAPIASVRLMAESLERNRITEPRKQQEYFRFIGQECRRLSSLIENVLDFSRIEQGRKEYEFDATDITKLVSETVQLMEPYASEKNVKLCCVRAEISNDLAQPKVDGRAIQQALVNLIDNAVKHSRSGDAITIQVGADKGREHVTISIQDNGPGIPAAEQKRIFERFYRLGSELRRETQGIGIGLSIVKHIVEAHGGTVLVESEPGKGSCFTLVLPVDPIFRSTPRN